MTSFDYILRTSIRFNQSTFAKLKTYAIIFDLNNLLTADKS